jgi:hypothetical protein
MLIALVEWQLGSNEYLQARKGGVCAAKREGKRKDSMELTWSRPRRLDKWINTRCTSLLAWEHAVHDALSIMFRLVGRCLVRRVPKQEHAHGSEKVTTYSACCK